MDKNLNGPMDCVTLIFGVVPQLLCLTEWDQKYTMGTISGTVV